MSQYFPITITTVNDKRWIITMNQVQCAYCLYVQAFDVERSDDGMVVGYKFEKEGETHDKNCKQNDAV